MYFISRTFTSYPFSGLRSLINDHQNIVIIGKLCCKGMHIYANVRELELKLFLIKKCKQLKIYYDLRIFTDQFIHKKMNISCLE